MFFTLEYRQAVVVRPDAPGKECIAVQQQVVRRDCRCDALRLCLDKVGCIGGRNVFKYYTQVGEFLYQRQHLLLHKNPFAVEDIYSRISHFAVHEQRQVGLLHGFDDGIKVLHDAYAGFAVGRCTGGVKLHRVDKARLFRFCNIFRRGAVREVERHKWFESHSLGQGGKYAVAVRTRLCDGGDRRLEIRHDNRAGKLRRRVWQDARHIGTVAQVQVPVVPPAYLDRGSLGRGHADASGARMTPASLKVSRSAKLMPAHIGLQHWAPMAKPLLTVCGLSSVQAIASHTPERIERLFFDAERAPFFAKACRLLAEKRKVYRMVSPEELKKITDTAHHQGVAAVITPPPHSELNALRLQQGTLCLHDVLNPHNVGAILRTAAFFGIADIIVSEQSFAAAMTASAWRVAEGGLTYCQLYTYSAARVFFSEAEKKQWFTAAAVRPEKNVLAGLSGVLQKNAGTAVICLGNEENGLPADFTKKCSATFTIPGSGNIESLNVSVAAALCLEKLAGSTGIIR